jgi:hypothetical protein
MWRTKTEATQKRKLNLLQTQSRRTPFLTKHQKPKQKPKSPPRKTIAAMHQSIHFLPAQQSISQTPKHLPNAIIPALQEFNQLKSKSARAT